MSSTNAERQRRYRAHKAGDHSLCSPERECRTGSGAVTSPVTAAVTQQAVTPSPSGLSSRGRRLWRETVGEGPALNPREQVVLEEACRTADRLDTLDRILRGDEDAWMRFRSLNEDGSVVSVVINNVLAEARQQQVALKALLAELRTSRSGPATGRPLAPAGATRRVGAGVDGSAGQEGGGVVADLAAWVANRGAPAAG